MFIDDKEIFRQSKQRFRRQRIHLSRIFVTNDKKQLEPVLDSEFSEVPSILLYQNLFYLYRKPISVFAIFPIIFPFFSANTIPGMLSVTANQNPNTCKNILSIDNICEAISLWQIPYTKPVKSIF